MSALPSLCPTARHPWMGRGLLLELARKADRDPVEGLLSCTSLPPHQRARARQTPRRETGAAQRVVGQAVAFNQAKERVALWKRKARDEGWDPTEVSRLFRIWGKRRARVARTAHAGAPRAKKTPPGARSEIRGRRRRTTTMPGAPPAAEPEPAESRKEKKRRRKEEKRDKKRKNKEEKAARKLARRREKKARRHKGEQIVEVLSSSVEDA